MMSARAVSVFGTEQPVMPRQLLTAGRLSAELDGGNLRYVRWGDAEVLRAISFVVRDTRWGTYTPVLDGPHVAQSPDGFRVSYTATCEGQEGRLHYVAEIDAHADGRLRFSATATTPDGFSTNRTGFVVLHGLEGVVGRLLTITHTSGTQTRATFPVLVQPHQPAMDIKALGHEPRDGLHVAVTFEGDTFEMEDQRNWTDASFKTYSRPLALGFPYRLEPDATLSQAVELRIDGAAPAKAVGGADRVSVSVGEPTGGVMPDIGLFLDGADADGISTALASAVAACRPGCLIARIDGRSPEALAQLDACAQAAARIGCALGLEWMIDGIEPLAELSELAGWVASHPTGLLNLAVFPARESAAKAVLAAARQRFAGIAIGGGSPTGFTELNRSRPPAGLDFVCHATQAVVHAADDTSVMETLTALHSIAATMRDMAGEVPYRIGPVSIGMVPSASAPAVAANPDNQRLALAHNDPRQRGLFAAAFSVGYVATAAQLGVATLTLAAPSGPFGLFHAPQPWPTPGWTQDGAPYPLAAAFAGLAAMAGATLRGVMHAAGGRLAAVAADTPDGAVLWLANLTPSPIMVELPAVKACAVMDAQTLAGGTGLQPALSAPLMLDAYAVAHVVLA